MKRNLLKRWLRPSACLLAAAAITTSANAAIVVSHLEGEVDFADTNSFGLSLGDTVKLDLTYDDTLVSASGSSSIRLDSDAAYGLSFEFGNTTFSEADDAGYLDPFFGPEIFFTDGQLSGISFITDITVDQTLEIKDVTDDVFFFDLFDFNSFDSIVTGEIAGVASVTPGPVNPGPNPTEVSTAPVLSMFLGLGSLLFARRRLISNI